MGHKFVEMIIVLGIFVVMPAIITALITRAKTNATNKRAEIALAAIEKNTEVNLQKMFNKFNEPQRSIKEKLLTKLLVGCILTFLGIGIYVALFVFNMVADRFDESMFIALSFVAVPSLCIGISFLVIYFVGRKVLKQEIEDEAKKEE